jgi:Uma2 family endonuclease
MSPQTLITAREFEKMAEELGPCELVRGEVATLSPGGVAPNQIVANVQDHRGRVLSNETGLIVARNPDTVRAADVVYFSYGRLPRESKAEGFTAVPPGLAAEVVGRQGWGETLQKIGEYLQMGVDRVWVIDPRSRRVHIYRSDHEPLVLGATDTLADEDILPGFHCKVEDFFAD